MTAETPAIAARTLAASSTEPVASSRPRSEERNLVFELLRTRATTECPASASCSAMCEPRKPLAPVTRTRIVIASSELSELLFVDAVSLGDPPAHEADTGVDGRVVLERPAELAVLHPEQVSGVVHLHVEVGAEPGVLAHVAPLLADAEDHQPAALGPLDAEAPEHLDHAEGEELPLEIPDQLVEVGQAEGHCRRLAVDEDDARDLRHEDELGVRRHLEELVLRERHEAPVVAPGIVEDVHEQADVV